MRIPPPTRQKVSIVVPVLNEEQNVHKMTALLLDVLRDELVEIIFVDDGSTDGTLVELRKLAEQHEAVQYVSLSRNFGHQNALKAGFDIASGHCVITLDGDLQHPVELVPQMLALWRSGADIVLTRRKSDHTLPVIKKISAALFYRVFKTIGNVAVEPGTADFRLVSRQVADLCKNSREDVFFWRGFIPWLGFSQVILDYEPKTRLHGTSKYTVKKMLRLACAGITSFSILPLRFTSVFGCLGLFCSFLYSCYVLWVYFTGQAFVGWSSMVIILLFFGSVQLVCLGIIGEYIGKIYMCAKQRPHYIIRERSLEDDSPASPAVHNEK